MGSKFLNDAIDDMMLEKHFKKWILDFKALITWK